MAPRDRPSARIILINDAGAVLLFRFAFPDGRIFWATPGGELEPGESFEAGAARELAEETGLAVPLRPAPWPDRRFEMVLPDGERVAARERYFLGRAEGDAVDHAGWTELERRVMTRHLWWTPDMLRATTETVFPADLAELVEGVAGSGRLL